MTCLHAWANDDGYVYCTRCGADRVEETYALALPGLDPSLSRVEADPRCELCGHFDSIHVAGECVYHDSEGPCLCYESFDLGGEG